MAKTSKSPSQQNKPSAGKRTWPAWVNARWFPWATFGLYFIIVLMLFADFVFSNFMLYGSDTLQAVVYFRSFYVESVRAGVFPVWTPYLFGGMPFVDAFHSDIFYPFSTMKFLLPLHRTRGWEVMLHFVLAGVNMYFAARGWKLSRPAAAFAGLAYMLAPYLVSMTHPGHDGKIYVTAWFPLGFLFLKRIWDDGRPRDMAILALILGAIILSPHVQMAYFALWGYAGYSVFRIVRSIRSEKRWPIIPALGALGGVFLSLAISAIQFYPSYNYVKNHSPRAGEGRGFEYASSWSLHPEEIVSEVVPEFSGVADKSSNTYWGRNFFKDNSEYGGLIALLLAVFAVFRSRFRDRWFFFGLGLLASLYALGAHTPLFTLFYHVVPNVKQLRAPSMIMFLYVFSITLCAGAAVDALFSRDVKERPGKHPLKLLWIIAAVLGVCAVLFSIAPAAMMSMYTSIIYSDITPEKALVLSNHYDAIVLGFWLAAILAAAAAYFSLAAWRRGALWALGGLALLVVLDTTRMNVRFIETVDLDRFFPDDPVVDFLKAQPQPQRVLAFPGGFRTNYFALKGVPEMAGYHGNQLRTYNAFLGGSTQPRMYNRRAMDLADIDYFIFRRGANLNQDPADTSIEKVYDRNNVVVFKNLGALSRARLVSCWEQHDPVDSVYGRMFAPEFDYRNCVIVDSVLPFASRIDTGSVGQAVISAYELDHVTVETNAKDTSLLVLSDNYYPAWKARLDGEPVQVYKANATFRGVVVPPGIHTVRFEYTSERLASGVWISIWASLFAILVAAGDTWWKRRSTP